MNSIKIALLSASLLVSTHAFIPTSQFALKTPPSTKRFNALHMSDPATESTPEPVASSPTEPEQASPMDAATLEMEEKMRRADELRAQEVFIKRSTGKHNCGVCDFTYDEAKGDMGTIGGTVGPGTAFSDLPSNWRCPTCRASKDQFNEVVEEIPGFEVNQGYGFGGNSMTSGQKNGLIFGGLGFFFLVFIGGYGLS